MRTPLVLGLALLLSSPIAFARGGHGGGGHGGGHGGGSHGGSSHSGGSHGSSHGGSTHVAVPHNLGSVFGRPAPEPVCHNPGYWGRGRFWSGLRFSGFRFYAPYERCEVDERVYYTEDGRPYEVRTDCHGVRDTFWLDAGFGPAAEAEGW